MKAFSISDILLFCLEHLGRNQNSLRWWLARDVIKPSVNLQKETLNFYLPQQKRKSLTVEICLGDRLSCKFRYVGTRLSYWIIFGIQLLIISLVLKIIKMKYSKGFLSFHHSSFHGICPGDRFSQAGLFSFSLETTSSDLFPALCTCWASKERRSGALTLCTYKAFEEKK